jgi:hypothetical protein
MKNHSGGVLLSNPSPVFDGVFPASMKSAGVFGPLFGGFL